MSTKSGNTYSSPKNINLKQGILRFDVSKTSNPLANDSTGRGLYVNSSNELIYWNGTSITTLGAAGGGGGSLDAAYGDGHTITVDDGAIVYNDASAGTANVLTINKSGAGSGDLLEFTTSAAFTGRAINIDLNSAPGAVGIHIDGSAESRTAADIQVTADSTNTHSVIDINASGSGACTGFDYVNSYAGSPGGNAISLTFDDSDGLSTGGILITRGTGVRTDNAIAIADNSTGNVSIIDVNITGAYTGDVLDINFSAAATGNGILITTGSNLAGNAIQIVTANERTAPVVLITSAGTDGGTDDHIFDINVSGLLNSNVVDITYSVAASDGNALYVDMATNLAGGALVIAATGTRTDSLIDIVSADDGSVSGGIMYAEMSAVFTGNMVTLKTSAASTTGAMLYLDLDGGVAYKALSLDAGNGARTVALGLVTFDGTAGAAAGGTLLDINVSQTGAGANPLIDIDVSGVYTGNILDVALGAASTGDVISIDMNAGVAASAIVLDAGNAIRTDDLIKITNDGSGNVDAFAITDSNTGSGHVFDIDSSGVGSGNIIDITYSAADTGDALSVVMADNVAGGALVITGAGTRTDSLIDIVTTEAGSVDGIVLISQTTNIFTGHVLTVSATGACTTGGLVHLNTGASNVAGKVMTVDTAGARTGQLFLFSLDHTVAAAAGGTLFDIDISTMTGAGAGPLIDIDITGGVHTGNIFDFATNQASTGTVFEINMTNAVAAKLANYTLAGTRTADAITITDSSAGVVDVFQITSTSTSSGHIFNIDIDSVFTGNVFDVTFGTSAATGDVFKAVMGTNVAGSAIVLTGTGIRTDDLIKIDDDSSGNSHIFDINLSGVYTGNVLDIDFSASAATGEAVMIAMGTNVAGRAIAITSSGTGVSGEGNVLDITHDGVLVAGADIVNITSSGAISSTSNALAIEPAAGDAGSYALYINAGGSCEGIKVDAGTVTFDETLTVTGACTFSSTITYRHLTEVVTEANTITAAESGTVFFLNSATEFDSVLPAPAAGLTFTFIVDAAPVGANYTISTNSSANVIYGTAHSSTGGDASNGAGVDTINFVASSAIKGDKVVVECDGTSWYATGFSNADAAITFTTVG